MKTPAQKRTLATAALKLGLVIPDVGVMYRHQAAACSEAFTANQLAYIHERATAHGISGSDVLNMMDPEIARCPALAIAKLKTSELSHITSQLNAPHLAHNPDNIVLEPADGTNQARGAADMSASDRLDVELRSEAQDHQLLANHQHHDTSSATFQDSWNLFGDITRDVCRGIFAFQYVDKGTWKQTIKLGQEIINDFPRMHDPLVRKRAIDRLAAHIDDCAGRADCHTAFLMTLLLIHAPWANALLGIKGLCTLARMAIPIAKAWVKRIFDNPNLAWARPFVHGALAIAETILEGALAALNFIWNAIETSTKFIADIVSSTYRMASSFIRNIWDGLGSLFSWRELKAA